MGGKLKVGKERAPVTVHRVVVGFLLVATLLLAGCFPVALPPQIGDASSPLISSSPCKLLAISVERDTAGDTSPRYLGLQFIFGVFPVTRLYSIESLEDLVIHRLRSYFTQRGVCPMLVSQLETEQGHALRIPSLALTSIRAKVNAYDLLFVRRLAVEGELSLKIYGGSSGSPSSTISIPFSETKFSTTGYSAELFAALQTALDRGFTTHLAHVEVRSTKGQLFHAAAMQIHPLQKSTAALPSSRELLGDFSSVITPVAPFTEIGKRYLEGAVVGSQGWLSVAIQQDCCVFPEPRYSLSSVLQALELLPDKRMHLEVSLLLKEQGVVTDEAHCVIVKKLSPLESRLPLLSIKPLAAMATTQFVLGKRSEICPVEPAALPNSGVCCSKRKLESNT